MVAMTARRAGALGTITRPPYRRKYAPALAIRFERKVLDDLVDDFPIATTTPSFDSRKTFSHKASTSSGHGRVAEPRGHIPSRSR